MIDGIAAGNEMKLTILGIVCLLMTISASADVDAEIAVPSIKVDYSQDGEFHLTYFLTTTTQRLGFSRNPDSSRTVNWIPEDPGFQVYSELGKEYVSRIDGELFDEVSFTINPAYRYIPGDYAPFQPFSDGSLLFHSGRLFACATECPAEVISWPMQVIASEGAQIIVDGEIYRSSASWSDSGSGINVYIGDIGPRRSTDLISVVDPGLPTELKLQLEKFFPFIMQALSQHFSKLTDPPMLFASYGNVPNGRFGNQGGTLRDQVFMHWYGNNLTTLLERDDYIDDIRWFFAHEAAHLFQTANPQIVDSSNIWIHEGMAEATAAKLIVSQDPQKQEYVEDRIRSAGDACHAVFPSDSLNEQLMREKVELNYTCGLMIFEEISDLLYEDLGENALFSLWSAYENYVASGNSAGIESFLLVLSQFNESAARAIRLLIN